MDQKTIIEGLQKALANGSGTLDDLETLLNRAKADILVAKEAEAEAKEKAKAARGKKVADIANRILNEETTDEDMALIMNGWLAAKGYKGCDFSAESLRNMFEEGERAAKKDWFNKDINKAIDDIVDSVGKWTAAYKEYQNGKCVKNEKVTSDDPDDVIAKFLKSFGLR